MPQDFHWTAPMIAGLADGTWATHEIPIVDLDLRIGCGICETKCPVYDDPAIYCTSLGESRSRESMFIDQIGGDLLR